MNSDLREPQLQKSHAKLYFNHRDSVIFHLLEANLNFQFQTNGSLHKMRASMVFTMDIHFFRCSDSGVRRKASLPHRCLFSAHFSLRMEHATDCQGSYIKTRSIPLLVSKSVLTIINPSCLS